MSAKLKLFLVVIVSIFATAATGVYILLRQPSTAVSGISNREIHQIASSASERETVENPERVNYKPIPLESINSTLQGSDPADLALNAFNNVDSSKIPLKVEVVYPETNQAMVTITEPHQGNNSVRAVKYRVELTTFGRSLLVTSPRIWQIVWAGSQVQCLPGSKLKNVRC
jgi:hypothetical protein